MSFVRAKPIETEDADVRPSFIRQRRALLAVGLVLFFYVIAGVRFDELTVLGNKIALTRPSLLPLVLWVMWAYTLLRYYQLLHDLADQRPREAHGRRLIVLVVRRSARMFSQLPGDKVTGKAGESLVLKVDTSTYQGTTEAGTWSVDHFYTAKDEHSGDSFEGRFRLLTPSPTLAERLNAWLWVAFHTRYVSEYYLPLIVGACPVFALGVMRLIHLYTSLTGGHR